MPFIFRTYGGQSQWANQDLLFPASFASIDTNFVDVTSNLNIWYPFESSDVNGTTLFDWKTNTYDGTLYNSAPVSSASSKVGNSSLLLTASSSQYVTSSSFTPTTNGITICAWIYPNTTGQWSRIFDFNTNGGSSQYNFLMGFPSSTSLVAQVYYTGGGGSPQGSLSVTVSDKKWTHVVWTLTYATIGSNTSNWIIYLNSSSSMTSSTAAYLDTSKVLNYTYIGKSGWTTDAYYNGNIDDFRVYNSVLNQNQINAVYNVASSTAVLLTYSVVRMGVNFIINWTGTNVACVTLSNLTKGLNYGRFTTSGQSYSGIAYNSGDQYYITPYDSTNVATANAGLISKIFTIS